ncbi:hypothetical protein [Anaerocolumna xylanovorans]|uniref:Uncharacterized protein n=1 Tax=Anaerocolumna xylanovorans DSM 12503 TaxID=1121345 RepID=A0A1M7YBW3_9FIRM|nr:hypothetical protein [Anaerocolumna xylanovorans]SHO50059.1 hypothetical protein SAMN02745217_02559 [Anaerocolumna xylanovorans DSM 12503]
MTEASYIPMTSEALEDLKEYMKKSISHAEYKSGNTWTKIPIYKVETLTDGRIAIYVLFDHDAPDQISGIRFYHRNGFLWAGGNESLNKEEFEEGVLYRYTLKLVQSSGKS